MRFSLLDDVQTDLGLTPTALSPAVERSGRRVTQNGSVSTPTGDRAPERVVV